MNFLIGWLIGERIGDAAGDFNELTGNSLWGLFWWFVIGTAAHYGFSSNFGPEYAARGQIAVLLLVLVYSFYRPLGSTFKIAMVEAVALVLRVIFYVALIYLVARIGWALLSGGFKHQGLAAVPGPRIIATGIAALMAHLLHRLIEWIVALDRRRRERAAGYYTSERPVGGNGSSWDHGDGPNGSPSGGSSSSHYEEQPEYEPSRPSSVGAKAPWWTVLEVDRDTSFADCKKAANKLRLKYHPDVVTGERPLFKEKSEEIIRGINEALEEAKNEKAGG